MIFKFKFENENGKVFEPGDVRSKRCFAFLPTGLSNKDIVWLEWYTKSEKCYKHFPCGENYFLIYVYKWRTVGKYIS